MSQLFDKDFDELLKKSVEEQKEIDSHKPKECCANCIHCAKVRKRPIYDSIATKICLYFKNTENSNYILEVDDTDICEVFNLNENKEDLIYE